MVKVFYLFGLIITTILFSCNNAKLEIKINKGKKITNYVDKTLLDSVIIGASENKYFITLNQTKFYFDSINQLNEKLKYSYNKVDSVFVFIGKIPEIKIIEINNLLKKLEIINYKFIFGTEYFKLPY